MDSIGGTSTAVWYVKLLVSIPSYLTQGGRFLHFCRKSNIVLQINLVL